jgi:hypothetical protein
MLSKHPGNTRFLSMRCSVCLEKTVAMAAKLFPVSRLFFLKAKSSGRVA